MPWLCLAMLWNKWGYAGKCIVHVHSLLEVPLTGEREWKTLMIIYYSLLCFFMHKCWIYRRTSPLLPITKCDDEMWALPPSYSYYNKHFHPFLKKEICERDERIPLFLAGQKKTRKDVLKLINAYEIYFEFQRNRNVYWLIFFNGSFYPTLKPHCLTWVGN